MGEGACEFGTEECLFRQIERKDRVYAMDHKVRAVPCGSLDRDSLGPNGMVCELGPFRRVAIA